MWTRLLTVLFVIAGRCNSEHNRKVTAAYVNALFAKGVIHYDAVPFVKLMSKNRTRKIDKPQLKDADDQSKEGMEKRKSTTLTIYHAIGINFDFSQGWAALGCMMVVCVYDALVPPTGKATFATTKASPNESFFPEESWVLLSWLNEPAGFTSTSTGQAMLEGLHFWVVLWAHCSCGFNAVRDRGASPSPYLSISYAILQLRHSFH